MIRPTKAEMIAAFSEMRQLADELYGTYANDVQTDRAGRMAELNSRVAKCGEILWRFPFDEIEAAITKHSVQP